MTAQAAHLPRWLRAVLDWWPAGLLAILLVFAVLAPWLAPLDPDRQNLLARLK